MALCSAWAGVLVGSHARDSEGLENIGELGEDTLRLEWRTPLLQNVQDDLPQALPISFLSIAAEEGREFANYNPNFFLNSLSTSATVLWSMPLPSAEVSLLPSV